MLLSPIIWVITLLAKSPHWRSIIQSGQRVNLQVIVRPSAIPSVGNPQGFQTICKYAIDFEIKR